MIKFVLPRIMVISKVEGEPSIYDHYVGHPIDKIINERTNDNIVIYLDDIPGDFHVLDEEDEHEKAAD